MQDRDGRARCEIFGDFDNSNISLWGPDIWWQTIAIEYHNWWSQQGLVIQPRLADIVKFTKATYINLTLSNGM